jgi:DNA primase
MNVSDEIKARIDIVDLVSETVKLRHAGKNYSGFCPFHANTRTPAFVVFPDTGTWRCFGTCNEGGDIFKFVMKKEGLDFSEALKVLARKAGVKLEAFTPEKQKENEEGEQLRHLLEEVAIFYQSHLLQSNEGKAALQYLTEKRGVKKETVENFGIGFAPSGWDSTLTHFSAKGYTPVQLSNAGLTVQRDEGGQYDRFRGRIMFPVRDAGGRMAGFGARVLNPEDVPKFINSPQTRLFDKSRLLFGLERARKPIREQDQAVIVEGYLDVLALHQEGFPNATSPMGTALTEMQLHQLKRFTRRIVLALDPDAAGAKATLRGLEIARDALDHSDDLVFDARGLLHHESRLQADLRVCTLPPGMDPDDIVHGNPRQWQEIISSAKPVITHVMNTLCQGRDLDDPKTKSQIASQIMPLIGDVPDSVERDAYQQQLARLLKVEVTALRGLSATRTAGSGARKRQTQEQAKPEVSFSDASKLREKNNAQEKYCLQILLPKPELIYRINRLLASGGLAQLTTNDFEDARNQQLAALLLQSLEQDSKDPSQFVQENHMAELDELIAELTAPAPTESKPRNRQMNAMKQTEEIMRSLLLLRQARIQMELHQLQTLLNEIQENKEGEPADFQKQISEHILIRGKLDLALADPLQLAKTANV